MKAIIYSLSQDTSAGMSTELFTDEASRDTAWAMLIKATDYDRFRAWSDTEELDEKEAIEEEWREDQAGWQCYFSKGEQEIKITGALSLPVNLPPHNPDRWQTVDGLDEPGMSNGDRVEYARKHVSWMFANTEDESNFSDLICNLLHLAHSKGMDPAEILSTAAGNFHAEASALPETLSPSLS